VKIGLVDVEINGLSEIVENKIKKKTTAFYKPTFNQLQFYG